MWFAVLAGSAMVVLAILLTGPAGRLLAAMEEYDQRRAASRVHRHGKGVSVADTLAASRAVARERAARRYAPAPVEPAWADLVAA
jgi:hypothetical protein